jgi:apolipoprotein N-acyltransferase
MADQLANMIAPVWPGAAPGGADRPSRSWLWLVLGGVCTPFMSAQTSIAVAAWLAPVWLLRFCRTTAPSRSLPAVAAVVAIGSAIAFRSDFIPGGAVGLGTGLATASLAYALLFGVDRLLWQRFGPLTGTLVFPSASTALGYLTGVTEFVGSFGWLVRYRGWSGACG